MLCRFTGLDDLDACGSFVVSKIAPDLLGRLVACIMVLPAGPLI